MTSSEGSCFARKCDSRNHDHNFSTLTILLAGDCARFWAVLSEHERLSAEHRFHVVMCLFCSGQCQTASMCFISVKSAEAACFLLQFKYNCLGTLVQSQDSKGKNDITC